MSLEISDDKLLDLMSGINAQLTTLNSNMTMVLEKLSTHELRIQRLEETKSSLKDDIIKWLVKGLVAAVIVIGSLTGAASLIKGIFGI